MKQVGIVTAQVIATIALYVAIAAAWYTTFYYMDRWFDNSVEPFLNRRFEERRKKRALKAADRAKTKPDGKGPLTNPGFANA